LYVTWAQQIRKFDLSALLRPCTLLIGFSRSQPVFGATQGFVGNRSLTQVRIFGAIGYVAAPLSPQSSGRRSRTQTSRNFGNNDRSRQSEYRRRALGNFLAIGRLRSEIKPNLA
jgi:hypothetical protein